MIQNKKIRIVLIHAMPFSIDPIEQAFSKLWPETQTVNILDDSLSQDLLEAGSLTEKITERIIALAEYALGIGADGILYTCSAFGDAIEQAKEKLNIPVLKPNEAMFEEALKAGTKIGMLATFGPSIPSLESEFRTLSNLTNTGAKLTSILQKEALAALRAGDKEEHNRLLKKAATSLTGCDAVMLAQFSASQAFASVNEIVDCPVLTSPHSAVAKLKREVA
ncbi:MAG: aspartate/glutamate racemase family protein [Deltaproteobacteria bacterium]|nr:aspartate/glutamate racemase family protein [Deltaproteobacteria bacterium]